MSPFDFERAMTEETIAMTQKAVDRLGVVHQVVSRQLRQREAACQLGLSVRQIERLVTRYRAEGPSGLVSRRLGRRPAGNALSDAVRQEVLGLVRTHYPDFGPTLTCEKLAAHHGHKLSAETLRQWMIAVGLWKPRARKDNEKSIHATVEQAKTIQLNRQAHKPAPDHP